MTGPTIQGIKLAAARLPPILNDSSLQDDHTVRENVEIHHTSSIIPISQGYKKPNHKALNRLHLKNMVLVHESCHKNANITLRNNNEFIQSDSGEPSAGRLARSVRRERKSSGRSIYP